MPMRLKHKKAEKKRKSPPLKLVMSRLFDPMAEITLAEIRRSFEPFGEKYPPVLTLKQAAELANIAQGTLKRKVSEGKFQKSVKRGKPLLFWRDKFIQELFK